MADLETAMFRAQMLGAVVIVIAVISFTYVNHAYIMIGMCIIAAILYIDIILSERLNQNIDRVIAQKEKESCQDDK